MFTSRKKVDRRERSRETERMKSYDDIQEITNSYGRYTDRRLTTESIPLILTSPGGSDV